LSGLLRLRQAATILSNTAPAAQLPASTSPRMRELYAAADMAARESTASVLLLGETGVGKSTLARRIHALGPRAAKPFLEVSCASLEPQLVESELFGHERGAFTSAVAQKRGLVEAAEGGTLFLDEVGELPAGAQAKLLSFLDSGQFRRVGGTRSLTSDVRIVAATNVDLAAAVEAKTFRKDLYYRLRVFPLELLPLRERREDLPSLIEQLLFGLRGRHAPVLGPGVIEALSRYAWPGNLRELRNALERAAILCRGGPMGPEHLPVEVQQPRASEVAARTLAEVEAQHIRRVLLEAQGNRTRAAEALGVDRSTLRRKLSELRLEE
jgi:DNA-binding NtrC family response regulator